MSNPTRKSNRSELFHSLNLTRPANQLRTARIDFWGAVALVCVIGTLARFVQTLLSH